MNINKKPDELRKQSEQGDSMQPRITLCSVCHSQMPPGQSFCKNCGTVLCPHCRDPLPPRSRFCPKCGYLCVVEQPTGITQPIRPATPARPATPIPRAPSPRPQPGSQAAIQQPSLGTPTVRPQHICPQCGATIDPASGRCLGCGLLYGSRHRAMQQQAPHAAKPAIPAPIPIPRPQSTAVPQSPAAYGTRPQHNYPTHGASSPPSFPQRPNYPPPATAPYAGRQPLMPRPTPVAAGATPTPMNTLTPASPYQPVPPVPRERVVTDSGRRGLARIFTTLFIIILCFLIGGGIYYVFTRTETPSLPAPPVPNGTTDITPPSIQSVSISSTTETGAVITWTTDKPATSQIEYGKTKTYGSTTPLDSELTNSHSVTLTGLNPNTTYYFRAISKDATGNEATSEGELTTLAQADTTPPVISGLNVSNITQSGATITWTTNEPATSQVEYGTTGDYGSATPLSEELTTGHNVTLSGLSDNTTYYFAAVSKDAGGNEAILKDNQKFTTLPIIPTGLQVGNLAPDFTLEDVNGQNVKLSSFQGKIVMVNFWATLCAPCTGEMPHIQAASDNWSGDKELVILAINYKETKNQVLTFLSDKDYTFTVLLDSAGEVNTLYDITLIPTTFFIDANGIIKEVKSGSFSDQSEIETILNSL